MQTFYVVLVVFGAMLFSYAMGSISFAVIFSKAFAHKDVREMGSGNAGMTNVMRAIGVAPGILTFVCDALKGFVACAAAKYIFFPTITGIWWLNPVYGAYLCGVMCILGHAFPVFFGFKGGKGIATSVGIFAVCCPPAIIAGLAAFIIGVLITRIVSLSSLIATVTVVTGVFIAYNESYPLWPPFLMTFIVGAFVFIKHKENIKRLVKGEEKRLTVKKK